MSPALTKFEIETELLWITTAERFFDGAKVEGETIAQQESRAIRRVWALVGHGITMSDAEIIDAHIFNYVHNDMSWMDQLAAARNES